MALLPSIDSGKGSSGAQTSIATAQQSFMNTLQQNYSTAFSGQQNIINSLTKSLTSTLNAGPSQFGFSTPETTALDTLATTANSQAYANTKAAVGEAAAASGSSNAQLPTNAATPEQAAIAEDAATKQSNSLLGIQEAGFKQGAENYKEAVSGLTSAASLENPSGLASNANNAGESAASSAAQIQKENAAANPWGQVGGLVGSLAGAALNFIPGGQAFAPAVTGLSQAVGKGNADASGLSTSSPNYDMSLSSVPLSNLDNLPTTSIQ